MSIHSKPSDKHRRPTQAHTDFVCGDIWKRVTTAAAFALVLQCLPGTELHAQTMHKCKNADGTTAYQQTPCSDDERTLETRYVTPEANTVYPQRSDPLPQSPARGTEMESSSRTQSPAFASYQQEEVIGYSCNNGRRTWMQSKPCTGGTTYTQLAPQTMRSNTGQIQQHYRAYEYYRPTSQQTLTREGLCSGRQSSGSKATDVYQRNKMLSQGGC